MFYLYYMLHCSRNKADGPQYLALTFTTITFVDVLHENQ